MCSIKYAVTNESCVELSHARKIIKTLVLSIHLFLVEVQKFRNVHRVAYWKQILARCTRIHAQEINNMQADLVSCY